MKKTDNSIAENSVGVQAGNNINTTSNITHNYGIPIDTSMVNDIFIKSLTKSAETLSQKLIEGFETTIGNELSQLIKNDFIDKLRMEYNYKNLNDHFNNIRNTQEYIKGGRNINDPDKAQLMGTWIENIQNLPVEDELLSGIWENWFLELSKDTDVADLRLYLEKMKGMTSADAQMLLQITPNILLRNITKHRKFPEDKAKFLLKRLMDMGLIRKDYFRIIFFPVIACVLLAPTFMVLYYDDEKLALSLFPILILSTIVFGIMIASSSSFLYKLYRFTWIGKGIVGFVKKPASKENSSD